MQQELERYLNLLERRVAVLRLMAQELLDARQPITRLNLEAIYHHVSMQEGFCSELRFLDCELAVAEKNLSAGSQPDRSLTDRIGHLLDAASAARYRELQDELKAALANVQKLNRVEFELLRRSRRTINILINFLGYNSGTYRPPVSVPMPVPLTALKE